MYQYPWEIGLEYVCLEQVFMLTVFFVAFVMLTVVFVGFMKMVFRVWGE